MHSMGKTKERFDPKRTPIYKKAVAIAKEKYDRMNDKEKKQAHRGMAMNDMNLPGLPAFFPPPLSKASLYVLPSSAGTECSGCGFNAVLLDEGKCPRCGKIISTNSIER